MVVNHLSSACHRSVHFGLRASLLLAEVLRERGLYRELTQLFIKMTSEDADLRSAVCLEQAAHSFLRVHPTMARKYALHLILAGHRYARSVQVRKEGRKWTCMWLREGMPGAASVHMKRHILCTGSRC